MDERRLQQRFRIRLPLKVDGATGTTRDLSASGVYFETSRAFRPGARIKLSFVFEHVYAPGPLQVQCEGRVVRVESVDEHVGVAARILSYQLGRAPAKRGSQRLDHGKRRSERRGRALSEPDTGNEHSGTGQRP